jgi:hypothetical protein
MNTRRRSRQRNSPSRTKSRKKNVINTRVGKISQGKEKKQQILSQGKEKKQQIQEQRTAGIETSEESAGIQTQSRTRRGNEHTVGQTPPHRRRR